MTTDESDAGWFASVPPDDPAAARDAIERGSAASPADWPRLAVESGFADDVDDYYDRLHEASLHATREAVAERERADDQQLIHAVRALWTMARILV